MFNLCINPDTLTLLSANTPDTVIVDEESKEVFVLEVAAPLPPT